MVVFYVCVDPCTGIPNTRRCSRFKNRWTYNSLTDTCQKFLYYGCTPSPNTFRCPKACKNRCQGRGQTICESVVCEENCYKLERKNKCPKCICPNPCKVGYTKKCALLCLDFIFFCSCSLSLMSCFSYSPRVSCLLRSR